MVVVPSGEFDMGGKDSPYEGPPHRVTIAKNFAIERRETSFAEWDACGPSYGVSLPPMSNSPDGTTTISGQSGQSRNSSPGSGAAAVWAAAGPAANSNIKKAKSLNIMPSASIAPVVLRAACRSIVPATLHKIKSPSVAIVT